MPQKAWQPIMCQQPGLLPPGGLLVELASADGRYTSLPINSALLGGGCFCLLVLGLVQGLIYNQDHSVNVSYPIGRMLADRDT